MAAEHEELLAKGAGMAGHLEERAQEIMNNEAQMRRLQEDLQRLQLDRSKLEMDKALAEAKAE